MTIEYITDPKKNTISAAMQKRNIPQFRLLQKTAFFQIGLGHKQRNFSYDNINNALATRICQNKASTKKFLEDCSIPTPHGEKITTEQELEDAYNKLTKPLVIKPVSEMQGLGITTDIHTLEEAHTAYKIASKYKGPYVIIEEHIKGDDHRILILDGKYIAGLRRTAPFVTGDGKSTVIDLIKEENENRVNSTAVVKDIVVDDTLEKCLQSQSVTTTTILEDGKKIFVRMTGNICSGGISENITKQVHPSIIETCKDIGAYLNMEILGVDVITTDISKPLSETGGKVTEVNENPDITMHRAPYIGEDVDTAQLFIDYLYPNPTEAWIDITANDNLVKEREELQQHLSTTPKQVTQFTDTNETDTVTIDSPNKQLQQYLLDARTKSIVIF